MRGPGSEPHPQAQFCPDAFGFSPTWQLIHYLPPFALVFGLEPCSGFRPQPFPPAGLGPDPDRPVRKALSAGSMALFLEVGMGSPWSSPWP